jgi:hypothetical protein
MQIERNGRSCDGMGERDGFSDDDNFEDGRNTSTFIMDIDLSFIIAIKRWTKQYYRVSSE